VHVSPWDIHEPARHTGTPQGRLHSKTGPKTALLRRGRLLGKINLDKRKGPLKGWEVAQFDRRRVGQMLDALTL
jgi:hypothetical protein